MAKNNLLKSNYFILNIIAVIVITFIVWAYFAQIDQKISAEGSVITSVQVQEIQSFEGGIVKSIYVKEGQVVEKKSATFRAR